MLRNFQVSASGPSRSRLERPVYIPRVWLPSNILCLITDDAAIPDKHIKDKHSLLSVMSWSSLSSSSSTACLETFSLHCHVSMTAEDIPLAAHPSLQITASLPLAGHQAGSTKQGGKTKLRRKKHHILCLFSVRLLWKSARLPSSNVWRGSGFYSRPSTSAVNAVIEQWFSFRT